MQDWLAPSLICPECLPGNVSLELEPKDEKDGDILSGTLSCPACGRTYPIDNGVAVILPDRSRPLLDDHTGYNSAQMLSSYLWSHYSDLFGDPEATHAYETWSSLFRQREPGGLALDIGCAVGRLSFELSGCHSRVVGIDTSLSFIQKARELKKHKTLSFDLVIEGLMTEKRTCTLGEGYACDRVEFIVADALALPFPDHRFETVTSINILEKVASPSHHLKDVNRVLTKERGTFVFSDPFSWDESVSPPEAWLSAGKNGNGGLRGVESMSRYIQGKDGLITPPMTIRDTGRVPWKIRKTENLWEHITSHFIVGTR